MSDDNDTLEDNDDIEMDLDSPMSTSNDDSSDDYNLTGRDGIRQQLQSDVEAFLAAGGRIAEIPPNVVADPPRKPQSNYGGQPI